MLGPAQKNWLSSALPLFMAVSKKLNTEYVTSEKLRVLHAAFMVDINWRDKLEPARTSRTRLIIYFFDLLPWTFPLTAVEVGGRFTSSMEISMEVGGSRFTSMTVSGSFHGNT